MIRVSLSALPPAEMGTTMRTGLLGNWSALVTLDAASAVGAKGASAVTEVLLAGATPTHENAFKIMLVERTLASVMAQAREQA